MTEDYLAPLATIDEETGKPPESRVRSVGGVRQRINEMREAEGIRSGRRAKIQGLLDGNPPYPPGKLREAARGSDANINLRTGEGTVDAAKTPYYDLLFETERFLTVYTDWGDDPQRWHEWSEIISNGLHDLFDKWDGFDANTQLLQWQMCVHGTGIAMWEDTRDWRWKSRAIGDVLVPDDAEANIDELEECAIPRSYLPTRLYQLIKNEAAAKAAGWNIEIAKKAIMDAAPQDFKTRYGRDWEAYQEAIRTGDVAWSNKSQRIMVVDHLVEEFSGKITHSIVLEDEGPKVTSTLSGPKEDFLFQKKERFESFSQVLCPFFFDVTGRGLWHGVKGLGPKIFDFCELENRLTGKNIDQAMLGLVVVPKTADDAQTLETISASGVTMFKPGTEFVQTKLADNLEGPLMVKRDLQFTLGHNTGQYRQPSSDDQHAPTLGQDQMIAQNRAILGKGAVNRYYKSLDRLYRETVRRVLNPKLSKSDPGGKEAHEFREWCMERGVPAECLKFENICRIKATRSIGYGSPAMRELVSNKLGMMLPMMDERSRRNAQRTMLAPFVGQSQVDAFFPPYEKADVPTDHDWAATMENGQLRKPDVDPTKLVTPNQDHVTHFGNHFSDAMTHVQALQQDGGQTHPVDVLMHLHNVGPHLKRHLDVMSGDPTRKDQLQKMGQAWLMLTRMSDQLGQQVEESIKAEQQNAKPPAPDPAMVAALLKVRGELGIKRETAQGKMALQREQWEQKKLLLDAKTAHGIQTENVKTLAELSRPEPQSAAA